MARSCRSLIVMMLMAAGVATATGSLWLTEHHTLAREINGHRINHGLQPLTESAELTDLATEHSWAQARAGRIWHSDLRRVPGSWVSVGEVVGRGSGVWQVMSAFMASEDHRRLVLGDWREVGYGHVRSDGQVFVTVLFRR